MDWMNLLYQFCEIALIPLLGVLVGYLIKYIDTKGVELDEKIDNEILSKYVNMLTDTVTTCVLATSQTYVDALKKQGAFDLEAQKTAFEMTKNAVLKTLTAEAIEYLTVIYGDFNTYLTNLIEAEVKATK